MKIPNFIKYHLIVFGAITLIFITLLMFGLYIFHPILMIETIIGSLGLFIVGIITLKDWKKKPQ